MSSARWPVPLLCGLATLITACPDGSPRPKKDNRRVASKRTTGPDDRGAQSCKERTHLVLLGTGTPNAEPHRQGPSLAVVVGGRAYLVDAGPGVVRSASAAYASGIRELEPTRLEHLFLTHLHSDHTLGYPDLIFTPWVLGRRKSLRVWGPRGTRAMTRHLIQAYAEDASVRVHGLEGANRIGHKVEVSEYADGVIFRDERVEVTAYSVNHGSWKHAYGLRFRTPDVDICISGDTAPYPRMNETYRSCDLLVHEVYSDEMLSQRPLSWQSYHRSSHTSDLELGRIADMARPSLVVLNHQLLWGSSAPKIKKAIGSSHRGPVVYGRDLTCIGLSEDVAGQRSGKEPGGRFLIEQLGHSGKGRPHWTAVPK